MATVSPLHTLAIEERRESAALLVPKPSVVCRHVQVASPAFRVAAILSSQRRHPCHDDTEDRLSNENLGNRSPVSVLGDLSVCLIVCMFAAIELQDM